MFHDEDLEEMWRLLRSVVMFYLRPLEDTEDGGVGPPGSDSETGSDSSDATTTSEASGVSGNSGLGGQANPQLASYGRMCRKYRKQLFRYASFAEQLFGPLLCKSNLHSMLCALPRQQYARGHAFYYSEFWLERAVQRAKHMTKFRTTGCPEKLIVGHLIVELALDRMSTQDVGFLTMGQWVDRARGAPRADTFWGKHLDGGDGDGTGFLGSGTEVPASGPLRRECLAVLATYFQEFSEGAWDDRAVKEAKLLTYKRVQDVGREIIHSKSYDRASSRVSHFIRAQFAEPVGNTGRYRDVVYVGEVLYFLLATPSAHGRPLRLAVTDLYNTDVELGPAGEMLYANGMCGQSPKPSHRRYPVKLELILGKVVRCMRGGAARRAASTRVPFVPYKHVSSALE